MHSRYRSPAALLMVLAAGGALSAAVLGDEVRESGLARWRAAGISEYEYRYQKACECHRDEPSDTIVTVREGRIVDVRFHRAAYPEPIAVPAEKHEWFRTVDDLFALIAGAEEGAAVVRAGYDPVLGYPTRIYIDYDPELVGEELTLRVLALRELR